MSTVLRAELPHGKVAFAVPKDLGTPLDCRAACAAADVCTTVRCFRWQTDLPRNAIYVEGPLMFDSASGCIVDTSDGYAQRVLELCDGQLQTQAAHIVEVYNEAMAARRWEGLQRGE